MYILCHEIKANEVTQCFNTKIRCTDGVRLNSRYVPGRGRFGHSSTLCEECIYNIQLGQLSVNPPRLLLEVGGTST